MIFLPVLASLGASLGWAAGIVLAQNPALRLGAFEFTRIQLLACAALLAALCSALGYWPSVHWTYWPSFAASIVIGIILGNLAMIACLRRAGPRFTELLLSLKAPLVGIMAFFCFGETPSSMDLIGALTVLLGIIIAVLFEPAPSEESSAGASNVSSGSLVTALFLGFAATACQGFGFLVMKPAMLAGTEPLAASAIRLTGAAFLISLVALWPAAPLQGKTSLTPLLLGQTILPGVIGYGMSSTLLLYAFANFNAAVAAVLGSLSPLLVLPILYFKDGSIPSLPAISGACLAVLGITLIAFG